MSCTALGQTNGKYFKTFADTTFAIGDKLLSPRIDFTYSGGSRVIVEHYDSVRVIADFLMQNANIVIKICAHTDSRGSEAYNLELSEYWAISVKNVLVENFGIQANRMLVQGYGESDPLVSEVEFEQAETDELREQLYARNRRIEIEIIQY